MQVLTAPAARHGHSLWVILPCYNSHARQLHTARTAQLQQKCLQREVYRRTCTIASLPSVVVRVVCVADSIEIELLEQFDVSQHGVLSDSLASPVLVHVAVHSLHHDGPVIVQQLSTLYFILAESNLHKYQPRDR